MLVRDSPGFVVNRILMPYLNEAVLLVGEGVERRARSTAAMKRFGMPMGPLELLDQIGLDVAAHVAASMQPVLAGRFRRRTRPSSRCAQQGWLGQKSGRGFYSHDGKKPKVNALAENLLRGRDDAQPRLDRGSAAGGTAGARRASGMVLLMVNEAALALGEGLAADAEAHRPGDGAGHRLGAAPRRPAALRRHRGLAEVVTALTDLTARYGKALRAVCGIASAGPS